MKRLTGLLSSFSLVVCLFSGCAPRDPLQVRVQAVDNAGLARWKAGQDFPGRLGEAFDLSLQELKLSVQSAQLASGAEATNDYVLSTVDQARVGSFVRWGLQTRYQRVWRLHHEWETGLEKGLAKLKEGSLQMDEASKRVQIQDAREHMEIHAAEMARTLALARELGLPVDEARTRESAFDLTAESAGWR